MSAVKLSNCSLVRGTSLRTTREVARSDDLKDGQWKNLLVGRIAFERTESKRS